MPHATDDRNYRLPAHVRPQRATTPRSRSTSTGKRFSGTIRIELSARRSRRGDRPARGRAGRSTRAVAARRAAGASPRSRSGPRRRARRSSSASPSRCRAGPATLELAWTGRMSAGLRGLYLAGSGLAATQFEAADARRVFPSFDEPGFKAPWRLAVEAPAGRGRALERRAGARGGPRRRAARRSSRRRRRSRPTSSRSWSGRVEALPPVEVRGDPGPHLGVARRSSPLTGFGQDVAVEVLPRLEDYFGVPYAFGKLDQVGLPEFEAGAMENAGLVTYREVALLLDPADRLARAEEAGRRGGHPRARAPVVRQLGDDDAGGTTSG